MTEYSPPEVVNAEGYWTIYPEVVRTPSRWFKRGRLAQGLEVSQSRSNGCFQVRKEVEAADAWINQSKSVAARYGASARAIHFAGHFMRNRYLFPTHVLPGGLFKLGDYAVKPDVPFNEWERALFQRLFTRYHFSAATILAVRWLNIGTGDPNHFMPVSVNRPDMGVLAMMEWINTGMFMHEHYTRALWLAEQIDMGKRAPIEGYTTPDIWGGENSPSWRRKYEDKTPSKLPAFWTLGPDGLAR